MATREEELEKKVEQLEKKVEQLEKTNAAKDKTISNAQNLEDIEAYARKVQYEADLARMMGDRIEQQDILFNLEQEINKLKKEAREFGEGSDEQKRYKQLVATLQQQAQGIRDNGIEAIKTTEATKKYAKASDNLFEGMRGHVEFLFADKKTGLVGGMFSFAASMKSAEGGLGTFGKSFFKAFNFTSIATAMVNNFVESTVGMVTSFDQAAASFAAATGTGDQFTGTMLEMRLEGNALGVTFENSAKALQSLIEKQVGFLGASKETQKEIATQVALMERIGISTDTSAELMNVFTINMGKSQKASIEMTKSLVSMGSALGNSQKFLQNFQESLKTLAVYGEGAVEVFSNMAAAARAAGVEVSTLTGLAAKFDTFSEGAEAVGKLNAMLGSQLSSTEMLLMTEDKRIETLIQQVQISGESFNDMNKFKQMAIANAAGITDMNEAQRIFGMNMKEYKGYQRDMERQARIQENFNKAIEGTVDFQEKAKQFMAEFVLFVQPLADIAAKVLGFMTNLMASASDGTKKFILFGSAIGLAVVAFTGFGATLPIIGGAATAVATGVGAITAAATAGGPAMVGLGSAAGGAAIGMGAFALPVIGIGLALTGVVLSLGYLVGQFADLAKVGPEAVMVMVAFAGALASLSFAGAGALFGAGGLFIAMKTLTSSLSTIKETIGDEASAISNALENLALIATGTSAKAMGGATANIATELKGAVEALTTTKIDIKLSIDDGKLYDIMKGAVADVISNDGKTQQQIVTLARGA